jgi:hypothetical protein
MSSFLDGPEAGPEPELSYLEDPDDPRRLLFTTPAGHAASHGNFYRRVYRPRSSGDGRPDTVCTTRASTTYGTRWRPSASTTAIRRPTDVMMLLGYSQLATTTDL